MNIVDKHGAEVPFKGFAIARFDCQDVRKGAVYPYGNNKNDGNFIILDNANELQSLSEIEVLVWQEGARYVKVLKNFPAHILSPGSITRAHDNLVDRDINAGCVWLKSFGHGHDYFATREIHIEDCNRLLWTAQAYRYRMQLAQQALKPAADKVLLAADVKSAGFQPFTPEEPVYRYVTVEFTPGGKEYTYLLPNHLTAVKGDDAVVVVNNPHYPELKGTKIVRITGVYSRNPSEYYNDSLKRIEHVVSKAGERRKELQEKIKTKQAQLDRAIKRVDTLHDELANLEQDLENGNY